MSYDPLSQVIDEALTVDPSVLEQLRKYRLVSKLPHLPGTNVTEERRRLEANVNELVDRLLGGVEKNPTKHWVLGHFQPSLAAVEMEDTEGREHFGMEIESIMDILGIESSDGLLAYYLGGI